MKPLLFFVLFLLSFSCLSAQVQQNEMEQQLENLAETEDAESEDDSYLQQLDDFRKNPLNLNSATEADLQGFRCLNGLQIESFLSYRRLLGQLVSIYELQAIPFWDLETIASMRPFVTVGSTESGLRNLARRFKPGSHALLFRVQQVLEKSSGFLKDSLGAAHYLGSPQRLFFRYRYQYKNLLQFGAAGEKDAGEQFGRGAQKAGFDFYSFHLFGRNLGIVKRLALGDFTVSLGQGLLSYQSMGFHKGSEVLNIKRQSEIFRPYNSAGEYNFHRGAAVTLERRRLQFSAFLSKKSIDGNLNASRDSALGQQDNFSGILMGGYHRSITEAADRQTVSQLAFGGSLRYRGRRSAIAVNTIHYFFSQPLLRRQEPYNVFMFNGSRLSALSVDFSGTYKNLHFFGELAADQKGSLAAVSGLIASLDAKADVSVLYRNIARDYYSINANAFTESSQPVNENGLYGGLSFRPVTAIRLDFYADIYQFPWLRYMVDRPSGGADYLAQLTWKPNKQTEVYTRFRTEKKALNYSNTPTPFKQTEDIVHTGWRTHVISKINAAVTIRARTETVWYDRGGPAAEKGFLLFADCLYKPMMSPLGLNARLQYFETDGYKSRIYAFENDVQYSFSIPAFSGRGYRAYFNINYDFNRSITAWLRMSRSFYPGETSLSGGRDEIQGNKRTDCRLQVQVSF